MKDCLKDEQGQTSSMRIMSFVALTVAIGLSFAGPVFGTPVDTNLVFYWIIGAFAPKAVQKFAEKK